MWLDLKNFNTNTVINVIGMFQNYTSLENLNLNGGFYLKVGNMQFMFKDCLSLNL